MNRSEKIQMLKDIEAGKMDAEEIVTPKFENLTTEELRLIEYLVSNECFNDTRLNELFSKLYCKQQ